MNNVNEGLRDRKDGRGRWFCLSPKEIPKGEKRLYGKEVIFRVKWLVFLQNERRAYSQ